MAKIFEICRQSVRPLTPNLLLEAYRRWKRGRTHRRNASMSIESVFTEIYAEHSWNSAEDPSEFRSGPGTHNARIADVYVERMAQLAGELSFHALHAVDLGCGDMGIGKRLVPLFGSYLGIDIVKPLVERNRERYASDTVAFSHLDIIQGDLPSGDVCFLRQVLQHLSNAQVSSVLEKTTRYRHVFITEHLPSPHLDLQKNRDKPHGGDIRLIENSGIFLSEPPFDLPPAALTIVLEVEGHKLQGHPDPGVIRTTLYQPLAATFSRTSDTF